MHPLSLQELGSDTTAYSDLFTILLPLIKSYNGIALIFYGPQLKEVKNCRNYNASGTLTYYFISLRENNFFLSRTPLLRTLYIPPGGVRNNGSRLY